MKISSEVQLRRAVLEDWIVDLMARHYPEMVMHGGTAVWRCYGGNRFSRDIDFYSNVEPSGESKLQKEMHKLLVENGYSIREEKYNNRTSTLHIIFRGNDTTGKLDITFAKAEGIVTEYLRVDGSKRLIRALDPEAIFAEKVNAYMNKYENKNEEIHDLYDMLVLKDRINKPSKETIAKTKEMINTIKDRAPLDERELRTLILDGIAPSFREILIILEGWTNEHLR